MGIHIKLQIEIDDVEDTQLLSALESLLKTAQHHTAPVEAPVTPAPAQRRRKPPKPRFPDGSPTERFEQFNAALPHRAQQFIALVESAHPNVLRQSEAIATLALSSPKAIGGITGSITRWASVDDIALPWVAEQLNGERVWRWIGLEAAQHGLTHSMPALDEVTLNSYTQLSPRLFKFHALVHDAGEMSGSEISSAMELKNRAALTGLESALKRWVPTRGLPLPLEVIGSGDDRSYRWLAGFDEAQHE